MGGEPGSGKTTIMNTIRSKLKLKSKVFKKILNFEESADKKIFIFGKYVGDKYDGTDRISMAVQPVAEEFIKNKKSKGITILFEGDRLFNQKLLTFISKLCPLAIVILVTSDKIKHKRYKARKDDRNKTFLKSKKTKTKNMYMQFPKAIVLNSETEQDHKKNVDLYRSLLESKSNKAFLKQIEQCRKKSLKGLKSKDDLKRISNFLK